MTVLVEYRSEVGGHQMWVELRRLAAGEFAPLRTVGADGRERMGGIDAEAKAAVVWLAPANTANGVVAERETVAEVGPEQPQVFTFRGPFYPDVERHLRVRVLADNDA